MTIGHEVGLKANNRSDAAFFCGAVQLDCAAHHPVIGQGGRGLTHLLDAIEQALDLAGAVQDRIVRVDMQMREVWGDCHTYEANPPPPTRQEAANTICGV